MGKAEYDLDADEWIEGGMDDWMGGREWGNGPEWGNEEEEEDEEEDEEMEESEEEEDLSQPLHPLTMDSIDGVIDKTTALQHLQKFLGNPAAEFKSKDQRKAVQFVLEYHSRSMHLVLPTGAGKTMVMQMLHELCDNHKLTVVIVPLAALVDGLKASMQAAHNRSSVWVWDPRGPNAHGIGIMLVSVEVATELSFFTWCKQRAPQIVSCFVEFWESYTDEDGALHIRLVSWWMSATSHSHTSSENWMRSKDCRS